MSDIKDWSNDESGNDAAPPDGAPENGTLISDLNNIDRETMAAVRRWYESQDYWNLGLALEATGPADGIVLTGDQQAFFAVNQSIQWVDGGGTNTGRITAIAFSTNTTLTVNGTVTHAVTALLSGPDFTAYDTLFMDQVPAATEDNLAAWDAAGQVQDSGIAVSADLLTDADVPNTAAVNAGIAASLEIASHILGQDGQITFKVSDTEGIMLQWGGGTVGNPGTVTFDVPFSATAYGVYISYDGTTSGAVVLVDNISDTSFRADRSGTTASIFQWLAIGPVAL